MNEEKIFPKWILITVLTALFLMPNQTVFAGWSVSYSYGNYPKQQHSNKRYYKKSHYGGHKNHQGNKHYNGRKWYNYYRYPRLLSFDIHLGHDHGRIVSLPFFSKKVYIDGYTYHYYKGSYYNHSTCGYYVVSDPHDHHVYETTKTKVIYEDEVERSLYQKFVIKIRNSKGDFTDILIKKYEGGFLGPQGEYYDEFPKVSQLKAMYVK